MSTQSQSQQIKQNFLNHPYTQQANKFVSGQVNALDAEVSGVRFLSGLSTTELAWGAA
jgi:receptor expression-enhancing protein 5/6